VPTRRAARRDTAVAHAAKHTADLVRMHRIVGSAARPEKRIPPQLYPHMLENEYAAVLVGVVRAAAAALQPLKDRLPELLASARAARGDASDLEVGHVATELALQRREVAGLPVVIENAAGSVRRWSTSDGSEGSTVMRFDYGYIDGVTGADGEEVDVYLGPELEPETVFVVHQHTPQPVSDLRRRAFAMYAVPDPEWQYDEDKVMLGFASAAAARDAYLAQYDDPRFLGSMTSMSIADFKAALRELEPGDKIAHADAGDEGRKVREMIDQGRLQMQARINLSRLEAVAQNFGKRVTEQQRGELRKQVKAALGVDIVGHDARVPAMLAHFTAENVALIQRIPARLFDDVGARVTRAFTAGRRHEDLAREIAKAEGTTENAARLIARDQIGKLNGQVNASRQQELGIRSFTWKTVGDERVRGDPDGLYPKARPSHFDRDDTVYTYDDPPHGDDGPELPGEPINCRCTAEPVFDDILDQIDPGEGAGDDDTEAAEAPDVEPAPDAEVAPAVAAEVASEVAAEVAATAEAPAAEEVAAEAAPALAALPVTEPEAPPEIFAPKKNPKRVEAAKTAGLASAERRREIMSAVKSNLPSELHLAWDKEGSKFLRENGARIKGIKDRINAASKISEAFAETYGSGEASAFGNEGDRYFARQELEAKHAETWADEQERDYYAKAQREAFEAGDVDESGELTEQGRAKEQQLLDDFAPPSSRLPDDPPF
jgi:SPP1 gp7 family putative phage head morphogenesis protein